MVVQYANHLTRRGHHVALIIPGGTIDPQVKQEVNPEIQIIEVKSVLNDKSNIFKLVRLCWEMAIAILLQT